jgi:hypothetical protein
MSENEKRAADISMGIYKGCRHAIHNQDKAWLLSSITAALIEAANCVCGEASIADCPVHTHLQNEVSEDEIERLAKEFDDKYKDDYGQSNGRAFKAGYRQCEKERG